MANNRFFTNRFGLIYLAFYPPSIITANVRPLSASIDFFNFSETRACSLSIYDDDCLLPRDTSPHQDSTGTAPSAKPPPAQPPPTTTIRHGGHSPTALQPHSNGLCSLGLTPLQSTVNHVQNNHLHRKRARRRRGLTLNPSWAAILRVE